MMCSTRTLTIVSLLPVLVALIYVATFIPTGASWCADNRSRCLVAYRGYLFLKNDEPNSGFDVLQLAKASVEAREFWNVTPYWPHFGNLLIPLFPLVALSLVPLVVVTRPRKRWRFWREVTPAATLMFLLFALGGRGLRLLTELGFFKSSYYIAVFIQGLGFLGTAVTFPIWGVMLRRNLIRSRTKQRLDRYQCSVCGYSLFGLSEPRCPECGEPFEEAEQPPPDPT